MSANQKGGKMSVKDKVAKMIYIDDLTARFIKEIAKKYHCSESNIIRKALHNYIRLYTDLLKENKEMKKMNEMI